MVLKIASSPDIPFEGTVHYARWAPEKPPEEVVDRPRFTVCASVFQYAPTTSAIPMEWHLNFADANLFVAYDSPLMAQDEIQVAAHPVLGSLRDALVSGGYAPCTIDFRGPTPITMTGVQRRCAIDTRPDPLAGRPSGLYGNQFAQASMEEVAAATTPIIPPTVSNVLAMAAPACGFGKYERHELVGVLTTAYTGFLAARMESERLQPHDDAPVIHTGFWGCGAFGGNRTLMSILQCLAADLAGVNLTFWAFDGSGVQLVEEARRQYESIRELSQCTSTIIDSLMEAGFAWGISDGN